MSEAKSLIQSTENHRFKLAMLLVGCFFAIILVGMIGELLQVFSRIEILAAIFSGWITAVVGFYFLQQNTEHALRQASEAATEASDARKTSERAAERTTKLASAAESHLFNWQEILQQQKEKISALEKVLDRQRKIINKQEELISEFIIQTNKGDKENE